MSNPDPLDDLGSDIQHLHDLLDIAVAMLMNVPRHDDIKGDLDRVGSLLWVSRDIAQKAVADLAAYPPVSP